MQKSPVANRVTAHNRYAKVVEVSKRIRWDIDRDVIRGRQFDFGKKFLPDGLSKANELSFITPAEHRFLSQIQGRTYANIFGLVERFIGAKVLEISREHWLGDQTALEALIRFTDEELKHQEMFRRLEAMAAEGMPAGYHFMPQPNDVASVVLGKSTWAVLGLTLDIELFTQVHYRSSIDSDVELSPLWKDVFLFHWKEESQHAILDELEWKRENARLTPAERDEAVNDLIALVAAVDGILQAQAQVRRRVLPAAGWPRVHGAAADLDPLQAAGSLSLAVHLLRCAGARFLEVLGRMITPAQGERIHAALGSIAASAADAVPVDRVACRLNGGGVEHSPRSLIRAFTGVSGRCRADAVEHRPAHAAMPRRRSSNGSSKPHVRSIGQGPSVVLLHSSGSSGRQWEPLDSG